jgi:hypothetical protein
MKPDGTDKAPLCGQYLEPAEPSHRLHNGQRWFLGWQPLEGQYPDTFQRYGLCAVSQSGTVVLLATDPDVEPSLVNLGNRWAPSARWATREGIADGRVSFLARRWAVDVQGAAHVTDIGLYAVDFDPESLRGDFQTLQPRFLLSLPSVYIPDGRDPSNPYGNVPTYWRMDWSPDGSHFVYGWYNNLVVVNVADGSEMAFPVGSALEEAWEPRWSPKGSEVLFFVCGSGSSRIDAMRPDGSELRTVVPRPAKTDQYVQAEFAWSPHGTHLVYGLVESKRPRQPQTSIWRVAADGSGNVCISGNDTKVEPLGWLE